MNYSIHEINTAVKGELIQNGCTQPIHRISTDSRNSDAQKDTLFIAISGKQHNGHHYLNELYQEGIRHFLVEEKTKLPDDCSIILVNNSLKALQEFAAYHRKKYTFPIVGITGSNGKTSIKEWLYQLLREDFYIVRNPKSYNSQLGVALSVLLIDQQHELGIFEAGISQVGEMQLLEPILQPETGILTNIGAAHSENFSSRDEQLREKLKLFLNSKKLIYCSDDFQIKKGIEKFLPQIQKLDWSHKEGSFLQVLSITTEKNSTLINTQYKNQALEFRIPFIDQAAVENAIHCLVYCLDLGINPEILVHRFAALTPIAMRLELLNGINDTVLINDTYNSDINSLKIALDFLNHQKSGKNKTIILSDILQDKSDHAQLYEQVAELIHQNNINRIIGIGEKIASHKNNFKIEQKFYSTTEEFLSDFKNLEFKNEMILLKGARLFHFEKITELLQEKAHETVLEINLNALSSNLAYYRSKLKPGTKIMAMVKAFSYGSGSAEIAKTLEFNRADYLAVAYTDEGITLRNAGINLPIMVMNPEKKSLIKMIRYRLEPEIYSFKILNELIFSLKEFQFDKPFGIHLKLDTGMNRLGFEEEELIQLCEIIKSNTVLKVKSVFTHLAGTDENELDSFSNEQLRKFESISIQLEDELGYRFIKHALNSAGISRFTSAQMDMVRLGIGLYGIGVTEEDKRELIPVSTLRTLISQIKTVYGGETVGYGRKGKIEKQTKIATVPVGYADGFVRAFGNGNGYMLIHGKKAKVVGNVCMDMCMLDISEIPEAQEGDEVLIFGRELSVEVLAKLIGTIPYEILSSVSGRVKRIYTRE